MKIQEFKMKVTPEQSEQVQKILFDNGCSWASGDTSIINTESPFIFFWGYEWQNLSKSDNIDTFNSSESKELSFKKFMNLYEASNESK